jgi:hypothetical protein
MDLSTWWESLSTLQKIHWGIALPSTIVFVIQLIVSLVGGDSDNFDTDHDGDFDSHHGDSINIFSAKSILAFLMFYGWSGLAAIERGMLSWWGVTAIALGVGIIMMLFTAWLFFMLLKLQVSGTMNIENAIGKQAEVYITIPAKKKGNGQVEIIISGGYKTLDAVTEDIDDIQTGSFVEVVDVINDTLIVKRIR